MGSAQPDGSHLPKVILYFPSLEKEEGRKGILCCLWPVVQTVATAQQVRAGERESAGAVTGMFGTESI